MNKYIHNQTQNTEPSGARQQLCFLKLTRRARLQIESKQGGWALNTQSKNNLEAIFGVNHAP